MGSDNDAVIKQIVGAIRRLIRAVSIDSVKMSRQFSLTAPQSGVLRSLSKSGPVSSASLSRELCVTPSNITGIIDRLEKKGLVQRARKEGDRRVAARVEGANVVEEVFPVLQALVAELTGLQGTLGPSTVYAIYHSVGEDLVTRPLLPPYWQGGEQAARHRHPPLLNLPPEDFIVGLTEHYLFAALHAMLYASLLAENQVRVSHLEGAVTYLDDESQRITHRCHTLRQEEIIEEIEVILLSASSVEEASYGR